MTGPWEKFQPQSNSSAGDGPWSKFQASQAAAQAPEQPEANPMANRVMAFATGADDAMMNIPSNIAAGLRAVTHGQSYGDAYNQIKQAGEQASQNHGLAYGAGVFGGIGASLPFMPEAASTVAGRAAQSAAIGAGMGGVSEFADTKDIGAAAKAAAIGAATGGVMSPAVDAAAYGVSTAAKPVIGMARGLMNPEEEAARRVTAALKYDAKRGDVGLTPAQFRQYSDANHPVIVADLGGEGTRALARSAANTDPGARTALNDAIYNREDAARGRVAQELNNISEGFQREQAINNLMAERRTINAKNYGAFQNETAGGLRSPGIENVLNTSGGQAAVEAASKSLTDQYILAGKKPPVISGIEKGKDGKWFIPQGSPGPSGEFLDEVLYNLKPDFNAQITRGQRKNDLSGAMQLRNELKDLTTNNGVSSYDTALKGAASSFKAENMIEAGQGIINRLKKMTNDELFTTLGKASPRERELLKQSAAEDLANNVTQNRNEAIKALSDKSGELASRLKMVLGGQGKLNELEASIHVKDIADRFKNAVTGNSTTARQLAEMGLAGGVGASGSWLMGGDVKDMSLGAAFANLARFGAVKIDARVAERVGQLLASNDPAKMQQVTKMAAKNPRIMGLLRNFQLEVAGGAGRIAGDALGGK